MSNSMWRTSRPPPDPAVSASLASTRAMCGARGPGGPTAAAGAAAGVDVDDADSTSTE